ncbi:MAG: undecaprenyldiphospho-muramoylpentapeptide beta-N-acetylglucosaminyltransferase, partial [Hyphomicrobiaceae bacterium]
ASSDADPVILLSPACASYDQYKSFEHRGDHFRALFKSAAEQQEQVPLSLEGEGATRTAADPKLSSGEGTSSPSLKKTGPITVTTASPPTRNVMLSAGGTGGHLFPAFALAQELARRNIIVDLITDMRGDRYGHDFPARKVYQVPAATVKGRNPFSLASTGITLARGISAARKILKSVKPHAIIGFGGYPTVPPMLAATMLKIPSALHEQNAVLGRANTMLAKRVTAIATSFESVTGLDAQKAKVRFTGNPVRDIVIAASQIPYAPPPTSGPFNILIFGGSQGARFFSDSVPAALATYSPAARALLRVVQQARDEDLERVKQAYAAAGIHSVVEPFFANLPEIIANSHLVIGRAGASTTAELTVIGRPSILVPLPHALDNDQLNNARHLQTSGAAILAEQKDLTTEKLAHEIGLLLENPDRLAVMAAAAKSIGKPDAVTRLANLVEELMTKHST